METVYKTKGTCSTQIKLDMDGDIIKSVSFTGGLTIVKWSIA